MKINFKQICKLITPSKKKTLVVRPPFGACTAPFSKVGHPYPPLTTLRKPPSICDCSRLSLEVLTFVMHFCIDTGKLQKTRARVQPAVS